MSYSHSKFEEPLYVCVVLTAKVPDGYGFIIITYIIISKYLGDSFNLCGIIEIQVIILICPSFS
jgi:tetrahydromethanopterin S-methyltransferase subunit E